MLTPNLAAAILLISCIILLVVIPMLDGSKRFRRYISLRYTLVALIVIMALGCVLDFSHLAESSRNIVLGGGIGLAAIFVLVRTLEKIKLGNKSIEVSAGKGDIKVTAKVEGKPEAQNDPGSAESNSKINTNGMHKVFENEHLSVSCSSEVDSSK